MAPGNSPLVPPFPGVVTGPWCGRFEASPRDCRCQNNTPTLKELQPLPSAARTPSHSLPGQPKISLNDPALPSQLLPPTERQTLQPSSYIFGWPFNHGRRMETLHGAGARRLHWRLPAWVGRIRCLGRAVCSLGMTMGIVFN